VPLNLLSIPWSQIYQLWRVVDKAYITRAINEQGNLIRLPANQHLRVRKALHEQSRVKKLRRHSRTDPDWSAGRLF
jgi:DNA-directed RNA polymerase sigma subunit (sigma70/sigma32)